MSNIFDIGMKPEFDRRNIMAGCFRTFIIEWICLKPEIYNEDYGYIEEIGRSFSEAIDRFKNNNPDYEIISIKYKEEL